MVVSTLEYFCNQYNVYGSCELCSAGRYADEEGSSEYVAPVCDSCYQKSFYFYLLIRCRLCLPGKYLGDTGETE